MAIATQSPDSIMGQGEVFVKLQTTLSTTWWTVSLGSPKYTKPFLCLLIETMVAIEDMPRRFLFQGRIDIAQDGSYIMNSKTRSLRMLVFESSRVSMVEVDPQEFKFDKMQTHVGSNIDNIFKDLGIKVKDK